jgi:hypothetical protein
VYRPEQQAAIDDAYDVLLVKDDFLYEAMRTFCSSLSQASTETPDGSKIIFARVDGLFSIAAMDRISRS